MKEIDNKSVISDNDQLFNYVMTKYFEACLNALESFDEEFFEKEVLSEEGEYE